MASAKDYGTLGSTWTIAEPDLLAVIRTRLLAAQASGALQNPAYRPADVNSGYDLNEGAGAKTPAPSPVRRMGALVSATAGGGIGRLGNHEHHQAKTEIEESQQIKRIAEAHDDRLAMLEVL